MKKLTKRQRVIVGLLLLAWVVVAGYYLERYADTQVGLPYPDPDNPPAEVLDPK